MIRVAAILAALAATHSVSGSPVNISVVDFGEQLYRHLPDQGASEAPFALPLKEAIERVHRQAEFGGAAFSFLPLCDCAALDSHYRLTKLQAHAVGRRATLTVNLKNPEPSKVRLDLIRQGTSWQIEDVHGPNTPSFAALVKHLAAQPPKPPLVQ